MALSNEQLEGIKTAIKDTYKSLATDSLIKIVQDYMTTKKSDWESKVTGNDFKPIIDEYTKAALAAYKKTTKWTTYGVGLGVLLLAGGYLYYANRSRNNMRANVN